MQFFTSDYRNCDGRGRISSEKRDVMGSHSVLEYPYLISSVHGTCVFLSIPPLSYPLSLSLFFHLLPLLSLFPFTKNNTRLFIKYLQCFLTYVHEHEMKILAPRCVLHIFNGGNVIYIFSTGERERISA